MGRTGSTAVFLISTLIAVGNLLPVIVQAGLLGSIRASVTGNEEKLATLSSTWNLQTMSLPKPAMNITPTPARGGGDIRIVDGSALMPQEGPSGTIADIEKSKNSSISLYVVREGDTLSRIAEMFDVSVNTIRWANDIPVRDTIRPGQTLTILPVTGLKYTVKSGDTIASIAKRFQGDAEEVAQFNGLEDEASLAVGAEIIIPGGVSAVVATIALRTQPAPVLSASFVVSPVRAGYYLRPIVGGVRRQGIHGYNAVDIAAPRETPILASAAGDVIVARPSDGRWNGGYGAYAVIRHENGTQTLYAHASSVIVSVGERVVQGQTVAYVGATGQATGPHLHFEIRNGPRNPF